MKKIANMAYSVFFVAAIIFLIYCFAEFRDDVATIICATIVMLIATVLFIDVLITVYKAEKKDILEKMQERQDAERAELSKLLNDVLKYEKAIYVVNKRALDEMNQQKNNNAVSDTAKFKVL